MKRLRVSGIASNANRLREALAQPMTADQCAQLEAHVQQTVKSINNVLRQHNATPSHLSVQSRQAYQYLRDFDPSHATIVSDAGDAPPLRKTGFTGIRATLDNTVENIAVAVAEDRINTEAQLKVIAGVVERLEYILTSQQLELNEITPPSRRALGWFRRFNDRDALNEYIEAVRLMHAFLGDGATDRQGWRKPVLVMFKPMSAWYRYRVHDDGTRITFNTPFIAFEENELQALAARVFDDKSHERTIHEAMIAEPYQNVLAELEWLSGEVSEAAGVHHDLDASFARVNRQYFDDRMERPKLFWIERLTARVFGHYHQINDRLSISRSLDSPDIPAFALDHVMHHELLHKKHGVQWQGHRRIAHTPAFREEEKTFAQYAEANALLNELSARLYRGTR